MRREMSDSEKNRIAEELEEALDALERDPSKATVIDGAPLRRVAAAADSVRDADNELEDAVADARTAGHTWADIGVVLGVTRQAAFQRFGRSAAA